MRDVARRCEAGFNKNTVPFCGTVQNYKVIAYAAIFVAD